MAQVRKRRRSMRLIQTVMQDTAGWTGKLELDHVGLMNGIQNVSKLGIHPEDTGQSLGVH